MDYQLDLIFQQNVYNEILLNVEHVWNLILVIFDVYIQYYLMNKILIQLNLDFFQYKVHLNDEDDEMHVVVLK